MNAVVASRPGGPEVLEVRDVPEPVAKFGEVIVRVQAVGINFADTMSTRGTYHGTPTAPFISGREFAGIVEGTRARHGYTQYRRGCREIAVSRSSLLAVLTSEQSAAFPVNFFHRVPRLLESRFTSDAIEPFTSKANASVAC